MSEPFFGEVKIFTCKFAPEGWAYCLGQQMSIQQNPALYTILGTTYGGNGTTTFNLPNLQNLAVMGAGTGPGLTPRQSGVVVGNSMSQLSNLPAHSHNLVAQAAPGNQALPVAGAYLANDTATTGGRNIVTTAPASLVNENNLVPMAANALGATGTPTPAVYNNCQPWLAMNFCIATDGIYPSYN
ncbi:phage tail protein [Rheinheimera mangrovi]|uniref:phage tail protein n=1 Tax=Rheinheimera mangrovi TaxID=2498451 RepID=UPI000F8C79B8|nr:tail fiber protein [Rheinheimera mangrovi]